MSKLFPPDFGKAYIIPLHLVLLVLLSSYLYHWHNFLAVVDNGKEATFYLGAILLYTNIIYSIEEETQNSWIGVVSFMLTFIPLLIILSITYVPGILSIVLSNHLAISFTNYIESIEILSMYYIAIYGIISSLSIIGIGMLFFYTFKLGKNI